MILWEAILTYDETNLLTDLECDQMEDALIAYWNQLKKQYLEKKGVAP